MGMSIGARLAATANRPSGFDYIRLTLATGVIIEHSYALSYGDDAAMAIAQTPAKVVFGLILPMFFALSGFLVAGSLERCRTIVTFLSLRAIRIVPALSVEVMLSALILGPLFTTCSWSSYVGDSRFSSYFLNIVGKIHYELPGVFADNPVPYKVNGQLWTVPFELECYIALALIALVGIAGKRHIFLWLMIITQLGLAVLAVAGPQTSGQAVLGRILMFCFVAGLTMYRWRDRLPWSPALFIVCAMTSMVLLVIPGGVYLIAFPAAYMTIYLGLLDPIRRRTLVGGDYSYGLYLYGWPMQQAVASLGPEWHEWHWNLGASLPLAAFVAFGSWWLVEKPANRLRPVGAKVEAYMLRFSPVEWHARLMPRGQA